MKPIEMLPVTVGITAFNCEGTLEQAVQSALIQSHKSIHILIVDDCSTDRTNSIAKHLAKIHKNITVLRTKKNGGVAVARNVIIKHALTPFVIFFDDDDISVPHRIHTQLESILACEKNDDKKLVICHAARTVKYTENKYKHEGCLAQHAGTKGVSGAAVGEAILCGTSNKDLRGACPTCSQMARTHTYRILGGFDERLRRSDDTEFCIRAAENGAVFVGINEPLVQQRMTGGVDKSLNLETKTWKLICEKHRHVIERKMSYGVAIDWLYLRHSFLSQNLISFCFILLKLLMTSPKQTLIKLSYALPNLGHNITMSRYKRWGLDNAKGLTDDHKKLSTGNGPRDIKL
jgi:glycosyltransferase involved in cell wall biosynthesis